MKKITMAIAVLFLLSPAFAAGLNGIEPGDNVLYLFGGAAFPGKYDVDDYLVGSYDISAGKEGAPSLGLQYLYYTNPYFGIGFETSYTKYSYGRSEYFWVSPFSIIETRGEGERFNFLGVLRSNINPADRVRVYPVAGLGATYFNTKQRITVVGVGQEISRAKFLMPGAYAGLGFEADLTDVFTIGLEGRYNIYMLNKDRVNSTNSLLTEASVIVKLGFRF